MKNSPCAKLTRFITPNTSDSPAAISAHMPPVTMVLMRMKGPSVIEVIIATSTEMMIVIPAAEVACRSSVLSRDVCLSCIVVSDIVSRSCARLRLDAQIGRLDVLVAEQRGGVAFHDDAPLLQHVGPVGNLQGGVDVLLDEENGHAALAQGLQRPEHAEREVGGQAERGLVHQQQARARHNAAPDG